MDLPVQVLIVDDHEVVREGMRLLLSEETSVVLVGQAANGQQALTEIRTLNPQVVLLDLMLPDISGISLTRQIRSEFPATQIVILTGSFGDDLRVKEALQAGAVGYLLKDVVRADLIQAILNAAQGKITLHPEAQEQFIRDTLQPAALHSSLTHRELDVLSLLASGNSNKKIAQHLNLSEGTIKGYVSIILDKLNLADRTQAALYAYKHGLTR